MTASFDAVVVGGGIVGCACAEALSHDFDRVALVEPRPIGGGATAAGMGHIVAMDDSEAQLALTAYSQDLWQARASELPPACEWEDCGTLWVAETEEEVEHLPAKKALYESRGRKAEILDALALAEAEPNLRPGLAGALRVPGDSVVFSMPAARWLWDQAAQRGAKRFDVAAIEIGEGGVRLADTSFLSSPIVVNAAGDVAEDLSRGIPIQPRKGHLAITDRYPGFVRHQLVELGYLKSAHGSASESVAFNVQPRATGQLLIGSSRQFVGWDSSVDGEILSRMIARALEFMPGLGRFSTVRTWTGFRAATPDKLPLIGPWRPGVWLATGHEGLGITTSLATGRLIADAVCGREPAIDPTPYLPERFDAG